MVRWVRTATANAGKLGPLVQWGKGVTDHINSKHGANLTMFVEQFGRPRVHWAIDVGSLVELETLLKKVQSDEEYQKRLSTVGDLILSGSTHDTLVESV